MWQQVSNFFFRIWKKNNLKKNREHVTENLWKISHSKKVVWEFLLPNFPTIYQIISNNNRHNCSKMTILILASLDPFVFEIVWDLRWECNMYEENSFSTTTTTGCDPSIMIPIYKKKKLHLNAIIMHILFHLSQQLKWIGPMTIFSFSYKPITQMSTSRIIQKICICLILPT